MSQAENEGLDQGPVYCRFENQICNFVGFKIGHFPLRADI